MSALSITPPFPTFAGKDGLPLEDGYIWLGSANLNPQTNPLVAYWDETLTQIAQQPIRTLGGYPAYSGTPARLFISAAVYSILVQDKNGNTVYSSPSNTGPSTFVNFAVSEEVQVATAGQTVFTLANTYTPGTNSLTVYVDGVNQYDGAQYSFVETSGDTVTFTSGLHVGALVKFSTAIQLSGGVADSSQVTYVPAGAGAVTTNVQTKLRETVSVKDFGAVGDGVTDDTAAIQAAIDAHDTVEFSDGNYLVLSEITIPTSGKMLVGTGGTIVRGSTLGVNGVFYATNKDSLTFKNLNFIVQTTQTHVQVGQFIGLNLCNECRIIDCVFDAELKNQITNKESLFSAVNSPSCNRLLIQGNVFRYLYGNCCGANDGAGTGVNGQNVTIVGNLFYNHVDTGVGNWTNASNVTITGNVFERNDYSTSYNGVHIDVAGASYVSIVGNSFKGNTIGIRMLSNLGYSNNGILIEGNTFEDQVTGSSEPATGIKVSHYSNGATSNNEDVIIRGNTFKVKVWGLNVSSTVTDLSKVLTIQIDGNKFDLSEPSCVGVALQRLNPFGSVKHIPGSNTFVGAGAGAVAVGGNGSGTEMHLTSQQNSAVHRSNFQFTGAVAQNLASFYAERGCYSLAASVGTCVDGGGVGGVQTFNTLNGAPLTCINTGGSDQVISASVSDTKWDSFFYVVPIDGDYEAKLNPHVSGNTIDYYYLSVIRII